ncbi:AAA family ATPase, partial [Patescibacteria group bacterium]|nr:AAA family ATPase [Patescibacteria group bacterium]
MDPSLPLADQLRPQKLSEFVGQEHLVGKNSVIRKLIEKDQLVSMIFWGPPGSGKTTLAKIIANATKTYFVHASAVSTTLEDVRKVVKEAKERLQAYRQRTIFFLDEIHRFNKAQQDAFLPHVENGTIILIGATTENPSFEVIGP